MASQSSKEDVKLEIPDHPVMSAVEADPIDGMIEVKMEFPVDSEDGTFFILCKVSINLLI